MFQRVSFYLFTYQNLKKDRGKNVNISNTFTDSCCFCAAHLVLKARAYFRLSRVGACRGWGHAVFQHLLLGGCAFGSGGFNQVLLGVADCRDLTAANGADGKERRAQTRYHFH